MAKMIKCPTCGTPIEVPPQAAGQVVKCPGCGKGLKLVAKKPPGGGGGGAGSAGNSGGSMAGGTISGSVSAMTVTGETPGFGGGPASGGRAQSFPSDDLPNLDSLCAVCGRSTDPDELIEDNGRLICRDCEKGARSKIDRPEGGADIVDFKPAAYVPIKRAKLIQVGPALITVVLMGLVYIGASIMLNFFPKPVGTANASTTDKHKRPAVPIVVPEPETAATRPEQSTEARPATQPSPTALAQEPGAATPGPSNTGTNEAPPPAASQPASPTAVAQRPGQTPPGGEAPTSIFSPGNDAATQGAAGAAPAPAAPADPLDEGMTALAAKDYAAALRAMDRAREKYVVGALAKDALTPQQAETLEGVGAADLGLKKFDDAKAALNLAYQRTKPAERSRALVVNRAIAMIVTHSSPEDVGMAAEDLQRYLQQHPDDEYAADVFGTLLDKAGTLPRVKKEALASMWTFLDGYVDRIAQLPANQQAHPQQLKWGTEWVPASDVAKLRAARGQGSVSLTQAARELEGARAKAASAQKALDNAKQQQAAGRPVDMLGYQKNVDATTANLAAAQKAFDIATATLHKAKWLDQPDPVLPEARPNALAAPAGNGLR